VNRFARSVGEFLACVGRHRPTATKDAELLAPPSLLVSATCTRCRLCPRFDARRPRRPAGRCPRSARPRPGRLVVGAGGACGVLPRPREGKRSPDQPSSRVCSNCCEIHVGAPRADHRKFDRAYAVPLLPTGMGTHARLMVVFVRRHARLVLGLPVPPQTPGRPGEGAQAGSIRRPVCRRVFGPILEVGMCPRSRSQLWKAGPARPQWFLQPRHPGLPTR